jgi:hypothetical protein
MKERVTTAVSPGEVLQVHSSRGPIGQPVSVPPGTNSVTITFKDTEAVKAAAKRKAEKRGKSRREGRVAKRAAKRTTGSEPEKPE